MPIGRLEDRRQQRRVLVVRLLFVVGLALWTSLAAWWATYFYKATVQVRDSKLHMYGAIEMLYARDFTPDSDIAAFRQTLPKDLFSIVPLDALDPETKAFPLVEVPREKPAFAITVSPLERARLAHDTRSKLVMLAGEGSLLVGLLFVILFAMYRMLLSEWRLNRQRDSFVHAVTHELKSPIAGLRALLQSFETIELAPSERREFVQMGLAELTRLDSMVGNILFSTRLEAHAFTPRIEIVNLDEVVQRLVERRRLQFTERTGTLEITADAGEVKCDPEALQTILENLVDNALKYAAEKPNVRIAASRAGGRAIVTVSDDGIGLSREDCARVFDKFYRAPAGERAAAKGTGLGLFIARGLARACGGDLRAESDGPGRGARFVLVLRSASDERAHA